MTCPVQHEIPVGALIPLMKRLVNVREVNLYFHDYYTELYERFGLDRSEMMVVMPAVMSVDVLSGCDQLKYIGEESSENIAK